LPLNFSLPIFHHWPAFRPLGGDLQSNVPSSFFFLSLFAVEGITGHALDLAYEGRQAYRDRKRMIKIKKKNKQQQLRKELE
jgi:hypothetical protein